MIKNKNVSLSKGIDIIKNELLTIPNKSGVYQMIGENSEYLYIGKAKNLNNNKQGVTSVVQLEVEWMKSQASLIGSYERWDVFCDKVLKPAIERINANTGFKVLKEVKSDKCLLVFIK